MSQTSAFPANFTWGAATASYQIEGAVTQGGRGSSIWDHFSRSPGRVFRGHTGDVACDHYNRFRDDVKLMKELGLKAYRFSVAWPRILPDGTGRVNEEGLRFYSDLVDELLAAGITPWLTLYHWDLPWSLHLQGGWLNPSISDWFADYVKVVVDRLGDRVANWMTLNEPQVFIGLGYGAGWHAPGMKLTLEENLIAGHNALLAHGKAVQVIRARAKKKPSIGWAPCGISYFPKEETAADIEAARLATFGSEGAGGHGPVEVHRATWNSAWWMEPVYKGHYPEDALKRFEGHLPKFGADDFKTIAQPLDFFACNHYHGDCVKADGKGGWERVDPPTGSPTTTMKWDVTPPSLYWAAKFYWERYGLPVYFTENGTAATDIMSPDGVVRDHGRIEYLRGYLKNLRRAATEGVGVGGYFLWSLMDNYEWAEGYAQRFGIIHVDYATQKRTIKESGRFYSSVIKSHGEAL